MKITTKNTLLGLLALTLAAAPHEARAISDSFAGATVITGSNTSTGDSVSLLNFTFEAGELTHKASGSDGAKKSAWWRWIAPSNGFCTVDTFLSDDETFIRDTVLSVYTGASVNALTRVAANDDSELSPTSAGHRSASATFYATQGTTYHIAVDGYSPSKVTADTHRVELRLRQMASVAETRLGTFANTDEAGIHGHVQLSKTASHSFTAKLNLAGKVYPFSGVFSLDGYFVTSIERKVPVGTPPLPPLTLMLDGAQGGNLQVVSSVSGSIVKKFCTVKRFTALQPSSMAGSYTAVINNAGTLILKVSNLGVITGAAVLPDGTKTTLGSSLCLSSSAATCLAPTYASLHANTGHFSSYMKIIEGGDVDAVSNEFSSYLRPAKVGSAFYPAGLEINANIIGSTYIAPKIGERALNFLGGSMGAGKLSISMQGMEIDPAIMENLTFGINNVFKFTSPQQRKPVLTLNKANGLVTGSIYDQAGKKRTMTGVLYREGMTAKLKGHLAGTTFNPVFDVTVP